MKNRHLIFVLLYAECIIALIIIDIVVFAFKPELLLVVRLEQLLIMDVAAGIIITYFSAMIVYFLMAYQFDISHIVRQVSSFVIPPLVLIAVAVVAYHYIMNRVTLDFTPQVPYLISAIIYINLLVIGSLLSLISWHHMCNSRLDLQDIE